MCYIIESDLTSEERNTIPDDEFGLPNERKYPLHDKKRVKSAISYFYKCPKKDRYELAYNIQKAAEKFNVDIGSNTEVAKYLDENTEESWNNYVLEMITKINYSDQFTVLEQTKAFNFFSIDLENDYHRFPNHWSPYFFISIMDMGKNSISI